MLENNLSTSLSRLLVLTVILSAGRFIKADDIIHSESMTLASTQLFMVLTTMTIGRMQRSEKANPSPGITVDIETSPCLRGAKQNPAEENTFEQLRLNQWVQQSVADAIEAWDGVHLQILKL